MPILRNIGQLATCLAEGPQSAIHCLERAALRWDAETITWVGLERDLPARRAGEEEIDAGGRLVTPGLVDCHTHLAFGGWRADEFERRLLGESYIDIARAGGGILRTVRATRAASDVALEAHAARCLAGMARSGVTTIECKSGYGLTLEDELRVLRLYRALHGTQPVSLVPTLLAAHTVPPEFAGRRSDYVRLVCDEMVPQTAAAHLAAFCDVFVEEGAFSVSEAHEILEAGLRHGLRPKLHADQLGDGGGAALAARVGAVSADHLEHVSDAGMRALRSAGTVAVSLPIATAVLGQRPMPARALVSAGVPVAVATDFNPGSAPSYDLPLALWLACTLQRMTPAEALKGATIHAARAVGAETRIGSIEPGKRADFALFDAETVTMWLYHFRPQPCVAAWAGGRQIAPPPQGEPQMASGLA